MANTLSTTPDYVFSEELRANVIKQEMENGVEQRRSRWGTNLRRFKLVYKTRTASEFQAVRDLYNTCLGSYDTFTFTNPNDNVTYTCRFEEDTLDFKQVAPGWYDFEFSILEVR